MAVYKNLIATSEKKLFQRATADVPVHVSFAKKSRCTLSFTFQLAVSIYSTIYTENVQFVRSPKKEVCGKEE